MESAKKLALFYARVSTENEGQDTSVENQLQAGTNFFNTNPIYELAEPIDTYVERESGKSDLRPRYDAMLHKIAECGNIHYIVVKDLKRLSRSSEVSLEFKTFCKVYGVKLILLSNGGQEYDPNAESNRLLYNIESAINEEYVHNQSKLARLSHAQKMESKRLNRNNITFGYAWDFEKKEIVIDEEKAAIVREIFDMYVFNNMGPAQIAKAIAKKYGLSVAIGTVSKWLAETAYVGVFCMNKKGSELGVGHGQKTRRFNNPREEWVEVERPDLQIVDSRVFELAQMIREHRQVEGGISKTGRGKEFYQARFRGSHLFSSKVYCAECGYSYVHYWCNSAKTISAYLDSFMRKNNDPVKVCDNKDYSRIYESTLEGITIAAINGYIENYKECFPLLIESIQEAIKQTPEQKLQITSLERRLKATITKRDRCRERYIDEENKTIREELNKRLEQLIEEVKDIERQIEILAGEQKEKEVQGIEGRMAEIMAVLNDLQNLKSIDRDIVQSFIQRIEISKDGVVKVILCGGTIQLAETKTWNERGQANKKPVPSFTYGEIEYSFDYRLFAEYVKNVDFQTSGVERLLPLFTYKVPIRNSNYLVKSRSKYMKCGDFKIDVIVLLSV